MVLTAASSGCGGGGHTDGDACYSTGEFDSGLVRCGKCERGELALVCRARYIFTKRALWAFPVGPIARTSGLQGFIERRRSIARVDTTVDVAR